MEANDGDGPLLKRRGGPAAERQGNLFFPAGAPAPREGSVGSPDPPPVPPGTELILDLETKIGFDEIRGRSRIRDMGVSLAVTYAYADDRFRTYFEKDVPFLIDDLFLSSRVVGFNVRRFDYEVLRGYTRRRLGSLSTLDLLEEIQRVAGHRISLDSLLQETLGISKSGDGGMAIDWYRRGDWERLQAYCREDVRATKALYEHGRQHGSVSFWDRQRRHRRSIRVHW